MSYAAFAALIGVSNAKVAERYAKGARIPRPEIIEKIEAATNGNVTANDFVSAYNRRMADAARRQPAA